MISRGTSGRWLAALAVLGLLTITACSSPTQPTPPPDAPALTCPADVGAVSNDGKPVIVSYTMPAAVGGSAPVTVACTPPSGSAFEPGTTTVACTATDQLRKTGTCGFSVKVTVPPRLKLTRFMAFGDSLTEGKVSGPGPLFKLGDFPGSYPTELLKMLARRYVAQSPTMSLQGLGGERTAAGILRLQEKLASEHPEVLCLLDGANDLFGGDPTTVAPAADNMRTMVRMAQSAGARVLLANLPPQREGGERAKGWWLVNTYNLRLAQIAVETQVTFVDIHAALSTDIAGYVGYDGLHLTSAGYLKMADSFFGVIQSTLEIPGTPTASGVSGPPPGTVIPESTNQGTPQAINPNAHPRGSRKPQRR